MRAESLMKRLYLREGADCFVIVLSNGSHGDCIYVSELCSPDPPLSVEFNAQLSST
jgi:hypothetical protein